MNIAEMIERLENATGPSREMDAQIWRAVTGGEYLITSRSPPVAIGGATIPAYTASVDAAVTLVRDGWSWTVGNCDEGDAPWACLTSPLDSDEDGGCKDYHASAATAPLALCIAAVQVRQMPPREGEATPKSLQEIGHGD